MKIFFKSRLCFKNWTYYRESNNFEHSMPKKKKFQATLQASKDVFAWNISTTMIDKSKEPIINKLKQPRWTRDRIH